MVLTDAHLGHLLVCMVALPLGGALINGLLGARLEPAVVAILGSAALLGTFVAAVLGLSALQAAPAGSAIEATLGPWLTTATLDVPLRLRLDALSCTLALVIGGVGTLIHVYSWGYMRRHPGIGRYYAYLNLFCAAMFVLVLADALPALFVGWEGVGVCSYLLIGFDTDRPAANAASMKAFIVNRVGDAGLLLGMFILFAATRTLDMQALVRLAAAHSPSLDGSVALWACLALAIGVAGKSAQLPLYVWLPDAMAGPTPVSALIHAATMVTAGIYLMARLAPLFALAPVVQATIAVVGAATAALAASIAIAQTDIKKVLAYSTVSQLGYMVLACGMGAPHLALFHVVTHAFFKASLFLCAGSIIHGLGGEQDLRRMGGLWRAMPWTSAALATSTLAIAGVPPLAGFVSKDAILAHVYACAADPMWGQLALVLWAVGLATAGLTALYMGRLACLALFSGPHRGTHGTPHEAPASMLLTQGLLAALAVVGGALGWPHVLGGHEALAHWLAPSLALEPGTLASPTISTELLLMGLSVAVALFGLATAGHFYARAMPAAPTGAPALWQAAAARGWGIDALYRSCVVAPVQALAGGLTAAVEAPLIEGGLTLVQRLTRALGVAGQVLHSGNVQRYVAIFAMGLALLLFGWLLPAADQHHASAPAAQHGASRR
jgi:NADH-quinone oxidoreductase subunit L